jgi:hypothetical protein
MVLGEHIQDIDLPSIERMVRALWASHRHTDEEALSMLRDVDVLLALG